jgi:hypothetical protein
MHVMLTWDVPAGNLQWTQIEAEMLEVLKPYPWVRPMRTTYVVPLGAEWQRQAIQTACQALSARYANNLNVLISPLMSGGSYLGLLPPNYWPEVQSRTSI